MSNLINGKSEKKTELKAFWKFEEGTQPIPKALGVVHSDNYDTYG